MRARTDGAAVIVTVQVESKLERKSVHERVFCGTVHGSHDVVGWGWCGGVVGYGDVVCALCLAGLLHICAN